MDSLMDRIKAENLPTRWFTNSKGEMFIPDGEALHKGRPQEYKFSHTIRPNQIRHSIHIMVDPEKVAICEHPEDKIEYSSTDKFAPGFEGRECLLCHGTQIRKIGEDWPKDWVAEGTRLIGVEELIWPEDLVMAMVKSGKFKLLDAIMVAATACTRCMNVLAHTFQLPWGYPEGSKAWRDTNTKCRFCEALNEAELEYEEEAPRSPQRADPPDVPLSEFEFINVAEGMGSTIVLSTLYGTNPAPILCVRCGSMTKKAIHLGRRWEQECIQCGKRILFSLGVTKCPRCGGEKFRNMGEFDGFRGVRCGLCDKCREFTRSVETKMLEIIRDGGIEYKCNRCGGKGAIRRTKETETWIDDFKKDHPDQGVLLSGCPACQ